MEVEIGKEPRHEGRAEGTERYQGRKGVRLYLSALCFGTTSVIDALLGSALLLYHGTVSQIRVGWGKILNTYRRWHPNRMVMIYYSQCATVKPLPIS